MNSNLLNKIKEDTEIRRMMEKIITQINRQNQKYDQLKKVKEKVDGILEEIATFTK